METKNSTVKRVLHNTRQYDSKFGRMFVHQITFDNGDSGDYSSKSETCTKFEENKPTAYTIEFREYNGSKTSIIKPVMEQQQAFGGGFKAKSGSDESFALSYSKDVTVAIIEGGGLAHGETTEKILERADKFYTWLQNKKK